LIQLLEVPVFLCVIKVEMLVEIMNVGRKNSLFQLLIIQLL